MRDLEMPVVRSRWEAVEEEDVLFVRLCWWDVDVAVCQLPGGGKF